MRWKTHIEPANTFPHPMPLTGPSPASGHCSPVGSGCLLGVLAERQAYTWTLHSSGFSRWRGMRWYMATREKMPARGRRGWMVPAEHSGQGHWRLQPSGPIYWADADWTLGPSSRLLDLTKNPFHGQHEMEQKTVNTCRRNRTWGLRVSGDALVGGVSHRGGILSNWRLPPLPSLVK